MVSTLEVTGAVYALAAFQGKLLGAVTQLGCSLLEMKHNGLERAWDGI